MTIRMAIIRQRYTPYGGAERFVERALDTLTAQGAHITLITRDWADAAPCPIHKCDPFFIGRRWRDQSFADCVRHHVQHAQYDLVQSHERIPGCDIFRAGDGTHRAWLNHRKRILSPWRQLIDIVSPYHRYILKMEARMLNDPRLRVVICNSQLVKRELEHYYTLPPGKCRVIYSGVDTARFHPRLREGVRARIRAQLNITDTELVFLYVGSGYERKGVKILLKALARLPHGHAIIVGKEKRQATYEHLAQQLGIAHRCHFVGAQSDVTAFYGAADVFTFPTLYDPFANVILESLACGLPVITTFTCGGADLITSGQNGEVVDALDSAGLSAAMERMFNTDRRLAMGRQARATAEPYTLENMGHQLLSLYEEVLHGLRRGRTDIPRD